MSTILDDYQYDLPEELIAQTPSLQREHSRLMVVDRETGAIHHSRFVDLADWMPEPGLMVMNDARVVPARLFGQVETGARVEVFILDPPEADAGPGEHVITCLTRPGRRLNPGARIQFGPDLRAEVIGAGERGRRTLRFVFEHPPTDTLDRLGRMPLPPYIKRGADDVALSGLDRERYQTVYARRPGAVAAPTAGLHFSSEMLGRLRADGAETVFLTLFVGYGTFAPVHQQDITRHRMHSERVVIDRAAAEKIGRDRDRGLPVTAVGTTVVRALEYTGREDGRIRAFDGPCDLFIYPGFEFKVVDRLITNFHLPGSTLLMLVSALAGRELILAAYREAVARRYRFFSYGDAMLIR